MLKAIFDDQIQVLNAASEEFEQDDLQGTPSRNVDVTVEQKLRWRHRGRSLAQQSLKNAKLIERMQSQAAQSYDTVCSNIFLTHEYCQMLYSIDQHIMFSSAQVPFKPKAAAGDCDGSPIQSQPSYLNREAV